MFLVQYIYIFTLKPFDPSIHPSILHHQTTKSIFLTRSQAKQLGKWAGSWVSFQSYSTWIMRPTKPPSWKKNNSRTTSFGFVWFHSFLKVSFPSLFLTWRTFVMFGCSIFAPRRCKASPFYAHSPWVWRARATWVREIWGVRCSERVKGPSVFVCLC